MGLVSCAEDDPAGCQEEGSIIGRDMSLWVCGGGWFLERSGGDTVSIYFANSLNAKIESWTDQAFPIKVSYTLDQLPMDNGCREFAFDLTCIELAQ